MLKFYLKEEYRRHVYVAKRISLLIYPLYVIISTLFASYFYDYIFRIISYHYLIKISLISALIYGFGVSSFEFLGRAREKYTLLDASSILPISSRKSYFYAFLRDVIYYTALFIIPLYVGLVLGTLISSLHLIQVSIFSLSLFLSMLIGYSLGYFSFSLDGISRHLYYIFLCGLLLYLLLFFLNVLPFPLEIFQREKELLGLLISVGIIAALVPLAYFFTPMEILPKKRVLSMMLPTYENIFKEPLLSKIIEDSIRGGILIKSIFTYFFPMIILFLFVRFINMAVGYSIYNSLSLSIILSLFSVVIYSWLSVLDDLRYMETLPLTASDLIYGFIKAHIIITSIISIPILIVFTWRNLILLPFSVALFYLTSLYLLSMVANLSGYKINSILFNPGIVFRFSLYTILPGMILLVASIQASTLSLILALITSVLMIIITFRNFISIKRRWKYF